MNIPGACVHPDCGASTGFCDEPTFGRGELDDYGYWQIPCTQCARAWEAAHPEDGACWPFASSQPIAARTVGKPDRRTDTERVGRRLNDKTKARLRK
jgi:hypothetical protein